jgi:5-methylcytosine-specific restriction protein A
VRLKTLKPRLSTIVTQRIATIQPGSWRTSDMGGTARGYGYRWQQARARHLDSHPLCVMCEAEHKVTAATVVDHRIAHRGDQELFWDESNWQSLCASHHSGDKQREEARR